MTPAEIEPATFRFVAQHLNHCATAVTKKFGIFCKKAKNNYNCLCAKDKRIWWWGNESTATSILNSETKRTYAVSFTSQTVPPTPSTPRGNTLYEGCPEIIRRFGITR